MHKYLFFRDEQDIQAKINFRLNPNISSCPFFVFEDFLVHFAHPVFLLDQRRLVRRMALRKPKFIGPKTCTDRWALKIRRYMEPKE